MASGDTTYIIETRLDKEKVDRIIEDWAASIRLFKKEFKGHTYFQIKDWFGRIIGRKKKCFEYLFDGNEIIFKAWMGNYKTRTSLDGSYGWLIADEYKHYLSELFRKISFKDSVIQCSDNGKQNIVMIDDLVVNNLSKKVGYAWLSPVIAIVSFILCPIYGWPGLLLLPLGYWLAIKGLRTREGKAMSVFAIVLLAIDTVLCIVRILANCGIYLFI